MARARIFLANPTARDQKPFIAAAQASRRLHRPWISAPATAERYRAYLAKARQPNTAAFLVRRRADNAIAGVINLNEIVRGLFQSAYLGYYAFSPWAGHGYMTEGMRAALREAFTVLKLHRLEANIQPDNTASRLLVERCGFRCEGFSPRYLKIGGRWRDHERWAILAEDWRRGPKG